MQKVRDVMSTDLQYCTPLDNVYEVAVKMKDYSIGAVPICEEGKLLGIITDRDIALRGVASKRTGSTKATEIMTDELMTVSPETSVEEAAELMAEQQIRRLPVVDENQLVGMVSLGDLAIHNPSSANASKALSEISECHGEMHH
ncbi:MAG: CBS domain-containing protein [Bacillus sp. (in: firmicutes)]